MTVTITEPSAAILRLDKFSSLEDVQLLAPEWDDLTLRLNGSLYSSSQWCEVWWRHYGAGRELRLIAVRAGEELVGVLPFFIDRLRVPIGRARVAKFVGSDSTVAVIEPLVEERFAAEAFSLAMRQLFEQDRVDMVYLGPCSGADAHVEAVQRAVNEISDVAQPVRDRQHGSHTVFDISTGSTGTCEAEQSPALELPPEDQEARQRVRGALSTWSATRHELEREFGAFVDMHQAQWQAVNRLGHFGDWPTAREFSWDLVRTLAPAGRVRVVRLLADEQVVAYYWCFALNRDVLLAALRQVARRAVGPVRIGPRWRGEDDRGGGRRGDHRDRSRRRCIRLQGEPECQVVPAPVDGADPAGHSSTGAHTPHARVRRPSQPRLLPRVVPPDRATGERAPAAAVAELDPPAVLRRPNLRHLMRAPRRPTRKSRRREAVGQSGCSFR